MKQIQYAVGRLQQWWWRRQLLRCSARRLARVSVSTWRFQILVAQVYHLPLPRWPPPRSIRWRLYRSLLLAYLVPPLVVVAIYLVLGGLAWLFVG